MKEERNPIRVLVVDDSQLVRQILINLLESDPGIKVIGEAKNGQEAVEAATSLKPDIITLDIRMPVMDGFEATEQIMAFSPTPILIITSSIDKDDVYTTLKALSAGALDVLEKPSLTKGFDWNFLREELIRRVKLLSEVKVITHLRGKLKKFSAQSSSSLPAKPNQYKAVAIASSTGGPNVLREILRVFPENFSLGVLIVQHITSGFTQGLVHWLAQECRIPIKVGEEGDPVKKGMVLMAPDGFHMEVTPDEKIRLSDSQPVGGHKPSADILFHSVANVYGAKAIGVILTGMGEDGGEGIRAIRMAGGKTIAQDEESCVVFGMPRAAIELGGVDYILPPSLISEEIIQLAKG